MTALKLVNNTGLKSEKNLCYVNTELQLLYSTPDARNFFSSKAYRGNFKGSLPICDELLRLFRTEGRFQSSAAELRRLIGTFYKREDICNGEQQDLEEFHTLLLDVIEIELRSVECEQTRFESKFQGNEQTRRKFLNSTDGCCQQGHVSRTEEERFRVIKIDVPASNRVLSLNNLVSNHFSESAASFSMKCSECCTHKSSCPQTGKCKLREATSQAFLITTPTILYIQLLRFDDFQGTKNETKVTPENILVLPNNDKFKLVSIGNHLGPFINSGHYEALIRSGRSWIKADDANTMRTNLISEISGKNYIFVYRKFSTKAPFVATNCWEEVFEDQPVPPGLHVQLDTQTGKKHAKLLEEPSDIKEGNTKNKEHKNMSNGKGIPENTFENDTSHSEEKNAETEKPEKQNVSRNEGRSKLKKCPMKTEKTKKMNSRKICKGCQNEFRNMDHHLKQSFTCQNYYNIDEVINFSPSTVHEPKIDCTEDSQDKMTANLQTKGEKTNKEI